ncbi:transcriptional regulator [Marinomonas sp. SBI22]|jgi:transposase|uniref:helix-turn-helix domain-containing protein n=1 Tax=unclassified Marinomonas TaxID=196814 RepID=UPI0007AF8C37|nr:MULTISPECIES: helix-turn-helix domain-containing protein [unclassified Marinomonas]KZM38470.1 transcriptional regulator [Marinomonas sp. SBI22]KZM38497.1 transcriptional regulator [Marinomonas sp. SBI8L]
MSKYSRELKLLVAKACLDSTSSCQLEKQYSIPASQIRYWSQVFAIHGVNSFLPTTHAQCASSKLKALRLMWSNDWSIAHTSAVLNLSSPGTLWVWLKRYHEQGITGLNNHRIGLQSMKSLSNTTQKPDEELTIDELKEELAYLRAENALLKKLEELEQQKRKRAKKKR